MFLQTIKQFFSQGVEGYFAIKYVEYTKYSEEMQKEYRRLAEHVLLLLTRAHF